MKRSLSIRVAAALGAGPGACPRFRARRERGATPHWHADDVWGVLAVVALTAVAAWLDRRWPMIPGELPRRAGDHVLNPGRRTTTFASQNSGDRPIQVGSHYHFAETNAALRFDRDSGARHAPEHRRGHRRALRARTAADGRAGRPRRRAQVFGFRGLVWALCRKGEARDGHDLAAPAYAEMFGPTVGDRVRLADTGLVVEVEDDYTLRAGGYGEEVKFGGGKTIRDGMGQSQRVAADVADTVVTNALVIDHWGIVKADVGDQGRPHRRARQGRQPRRPARGRRSSSGRAPRSSPAKE